jgi:hypothetical protein
MAGSLRPNHLPKSQIANNANNITIMIRFQHMNFERPKYA